MSMRSLLPGDASGELMRKTRDPLAAANRFICRWLCQGGQGTR